MESNQKSKEILAPELLESFQQPEIEAGFDEAVSLLKKFSGLEDKKFKPETLFNFRVNPIALNYSELYISPKNYSERLTKLLEQVEQDENQKPRWFSVIGQPIPTRVEGKIFGLLQNPHYQTEKDIVIQLDDVCRYYYQCGYFRALGRYVKAEQVSTRQKRTEIITAQSAVDEYIKEMLRIYTDQNEYWRQDLSYTSMELAETRKDCLIKINSEQSEKIPVVSLYKPFESDEIAVYSMFIEQTQWPIVGLVDKDFVQMSGSVFTHNGPEGFGLKRHTQFIGLPITIDIGGNRFGRFAIPAEFLKNANIEVIDAM